MRKGRYEGALQQNETVDIYQDDFVSLAAEEATLGNRADAEMREWARRGRGSI